ncbi:MAG: FHA domain-containing protein [Muribaculaceae bacterium]
MPKKTCPNGHVYDTAIYGDRCPMCPAQPAQGTHIDSANAQPHVSNPVTPPGDMMNHTHIAGANPGMRQQVDPAGETRVRSNAPAQQQAPRQQAPAQPAHTVIRRPNATGNSEATPQRRLVGFLVTYNRNPAGKVYNIYEGRNYVGRDPKCDIAVTDDSMMSSTHMSILFRSVDHKFKFRDEQSSNGTYINKELLDEGELKNYDVIRVGGTVFIFMAIPII